MFVSFAGLEMERNSFGESLRGRFIGARSHVYAERGTTVLRDPIHRAPSSNHDPGLPYFLDLSRARALLFQRQPQPHQVWHRATSRESRALQPLQNFRGSCAMRLAGIASAVLGTCTVPALFALAFVAVPPPLSVPQQQLSCRAGAFAEVAGDCRTDLALAARAGGEELGMTRAGLVRAAAAAAAAAATAAAGVASGASPAAAAGRESEPEITSKAFIEVSVMVVRCWRPRRVVKKRRRNCYVSPQQAGRCAKVGGWRESGNSAAASAADTFTCSMGAHDWLVM